jgi:hypothetical protein
MQPEYKNDMKNVMGISIALNWRLWIAESLSIFAMTLLLIANILYNILVLCACC